MEEVQRYAGIGSRETPESVCQIMAYIARVFNELGLILASGGADGADTAFERGCNNHDKMIIFLPWPKFNGREYPMRYEIPPEAYKLGEKFHKGWAHLKPGAKTLMARNAQQILGPTLDEPVKFVLCWTPDGCETDYDRTSKTGGTGQAISIASAADIPVINMKNVGWLERLIIVSGYDFKHLKERLNDRERPFYYC